MRKQRISMKRRKLMTHHMMEHLHGHKQHYPMAHRHHHIEKHVHGAGIIGSRFQHNHPTAHHGRRTLPDRRPAQKRRSESMAPGMKITKGNMHHFGNLHFEHPHRANKRKGGMEDRQDSSTSFKSSKRLSEHYLEQPYTKVYNTAIPFSSN